MIFESLNARGEPLSQFDLLRNNLFLTTKQSQGEDRDDLYKKHWQHFESAYWEKSVTVGKEKFRLSELFLRHFLMANLATEEVTPLFQTYRRGYRQSLGQSGVKHEFSELHRYSKHYEHIASSSAISPVNHAIEMHHILSITSLRPIFLYLLTRVKIPSAAQKHAFHALESYTIRRLVCEKSGHKNFNIFFSNIIRHLKETDDPVRNLISLLKEMTVDSNLWPNNPAVKRCLEGSWGNKPTIRYVLFRMELHKRKQNRFTEDSYLPFRSTLTLEHVLPEEWKERWPLPHKDGHIKYNDMFSEEYKKNNPSWHVYPTASGLASQNYVDTFDLARQRDNHLNNIGNLTLLTRKLNSSVSNAPFNEKKESIRENSTFLLNNKIIAEEDWDIEQIQEREERLREIFYELWPDAQWFLDNIPTE